MQNSNPALEPQPTVALQQIMGGNREIFIMHNEQKYRLRITGNNKLILTK